MATTRTTVSLTEESFNRRVHSAGALTNMIVYAGPCKVVGFACTNASANARFIQFHDATTLPSNSAVPVYSMPIAASGEKQLPIPLVFTTGCVVAVSTTLDTLTISTDTAVMVANAKV